MYSMVLSIIAENFQDVLVMQYNSGGCSVGQMLYLYEWLNWSKNKVYIRKMFVDKGNQR